MRRFVSASFLFLFACCAFGGDDLKTLYITAGGSLYSIRTATAGRVVWPAK